MGWFSRLWKNIRRIFSRRPARPPPHVERMVVQEQQQAIPLTTEGGRITTEAPQQVAPIITLEAGIIKEARLQMGVDCVNYYNFGVSGQSGVGKSSFINGLLALEGDDACSVGEVETTQKAKRYSTKKDPYLMVWDLPGAGTMSHPANTYFEDKKLYVFDTILILSSERFLNVDFEILRSARKYGTPCVFVRTKCDIGVESRAQRDQVNALEASKRFREDVRSNFLACLENAGLKDSFPTPELFFISNNFFKDDESYVLYDRKKRALDTSLSSMDEQQLISFIHDVAKKRVYPSK